ncbi:hypothetical protein [Methylobacterium sp. E-045]|uniref:hypothetical protein n=1 Tax=Methylobacterium sp. E-045 TaxID=2836575 RepID=UPI001FB9B950|nr:hypothetical protein [Methylobacterium sp. E-045]MCJ2132399.1 hypothetical protein [Methylobacterium sp. E-045]
MIAIRAEYLNVYYRGASIFRVEREGDRLIPITHAKYLTRRKQGSVKMGADGTFDIDPNTALWRSYEGPPTLREMIQAADTLTGPEKIGLHSLLLASSHVIDVEIAFGAIALPTTEDSKDGLIAAAAEDAGEAPQASSSPTAGGTDRIDVATVEEQDGEVRIVFHEAKHFANPELRASVGETPRVAEQIDRYRRTLAHHADAIGRSYRDVCQALARIDAMRRRVQTDTQASAPLHPLITRVANSGTPPTVDPEPRLVIFGFDKDQRDGTIWQSHLKRLKDTSGEGFGLKVHAVGNTQGRRSPAFTA